MGLDALLQLQTRIILGGDSNKNSQKNLLPPPSQKRRPTNQPGCFRRSGFTSNISARCAASQHMSRTRIRISYHLISPHVRSPSGRSSRCRRCTAARGAGPSPGPCPAPPRRRPERSSAWGRAPPQSQRRTPLLPPPLHRRHRQTGSHRHPEAGSDVSDHHGGHHRADQRLLRLQ